MVNGEPSFSSLVVLVGVSVAAVLGLYASDSIPRRDGSPLIVDINWPQEWAPRESVPAAVSRPSSDQAPSLDPADEGAAPSPQQPPEAYAPYPPSAPQGYPANPPPQPSQQYRPSAPQGYPGIPPDYEPPPEAAPPQPNRR